jgi:polyferredoxin
MSADVAMPHAGQAVFSTPTLGRLDRGLHRAGDWLLQHQGAIRGTQWAIVGLYLVLVAVPAFLPLPGRTAHVWDNLTLFAQFVFWGIWWPFVLISMVLFGRAWCGLMCPEGTLSEFAGKHGRGNAIPRWVAWGGWPFVAFAVLTIYGQMVSVYQYPGVVLVVLGGSTALAMVVGYLYGRNKRVWCRYLCPVSGVFGLLSKLAPLHFHVDRDAWRAPQRGSGTAVRAVNCAPLVPLATMRGASACHMCGRCSGFRGAIALAPRSPNDAIVNGTSDQPKMVETLLIVFGLLGIAVGAFQWSASPWFIAVKQMLAEWLVDHRMLWPLEWTAPWWLLTNYPDQNDVLTLLDGVLLVGYIMATALALGGGVSALLALATRGLGPWSWPRFHHLAQTLIPLAGCGVFLGLSALTVTMLRTEGLPLRWVAVVRLLFLAGASSWSVWLAWRVSGLSAHGLKRSLATACVALASALVIGAWTLLFWVW